MLTLKNTLIINALSSGATGLGLLIFATPIAHLFGVDHTAPFSGVGIFLILFATGVFFVSAGKPINERAVKIVTALDLLWVVASVMLVAFASSAISMIGLVAIVAVAVWVAGMAFLQRKGIAS